LKQLKSISLNKIKIISNDKLYINKIYKLKLNKLKFSSNVKFNNLFYLKNLNFFQNYLLNANIDDGFYGSYCGDILELKFNTDRHLIIDYYLSMVELINFNYLKGSFVLKYKYSMLTYFIPFLIKNGKKLNTINNVLNSMSSIYQNLKFTNNSNFESFFFLDQFKHYLNTTEEAYNLNILLNWIISIYKPVFDIKAFNIPKIHKKKTNKLLLFKILYLSDKNRLKTAFKHISTVIKKDQASKFNTRIINTMLDMLLNYKKSYLYCRKIYIYEQAMEL